MLCLVLIAFYICRTQAKNINKMSKIERVRMGDFMVFMDHKENRVYFDVYPIQEWIKPKTGEKGFFYIDKETEPSPRETWEEGKCLKKLNGSYCELGVWEGRLYFPDEEYWGSDIEELSRLYNDQIIPWCVERIEQYQKEN